MAGSTEAASGAASVLEKQGDSSIRAISPDQTTSVSVASSATSASSPQDQVKQGLAQALMRLGELADVETLIRSKISSDASLLETIPLYLLGLGGKRMRPALTLMVAHAFSERLEDSVVDIAAGIELIHMATLLHDDIIDKSPLRRHKQSPFLKFGVPSTLLAGDFLLVRAFSLCARLDRFIIDETERACIELTEGEILETPLHLETHTEHSSITIARKKTASLFRLACISAGFYCFGKKQATEHLGQFGEHLGIAFQILDDILDVTADQNLLGKQSGMDLHERKPSIVNVLWLESGSRLAKRLLTPPASEIEESRFITAGLNELRGEPNGSSGMSKNVIEQCRVLATHHVHQAREYLAKAVACSTKVNEVYLKDLHLLLDYNLERLT